jgi:hypothetical protein
MQLKIEKGTFKDYSLEDISEALRKGLSIRGNKWKSKNYRCRWRALYA